MDNFERDEKMKIKMKFERTKSMTYYYCPICMLNSTNKAEIEKHFREGHQVKVKKYIHCNICGEGWNVQAFGEEGAGECADTHKSCMSEAQLTEDSDGQV